jgi:predicted RNA-binding protein associated with RNAse of E/G family
LAKAFYVEDCLSLFEEQQMRFHTRYVRLPDNVLDLYDDLVFRSERVIVGRSRISSANSVVFDGKVVLASGYQIVYFDMMREWFSVGKIRDLDGQHTGYYCDIITSPRLLEGGVVEITDLFLDLWVAPDLRYKVLDEEELEDALKKGWVTKQLHETAKKELKKLIALVEERKFPPPLVRQLEEKLRL